jgi:hypothetical protein
VICGDGGAGHRAGEAAIAYEHGADIEALMPKLRHSDYFTDPKVQELAALERADPGYCRRVADFVVGRKVRRVVSGTVESGLVGRRMGCGVCVGEGAVWGRWDDGRDVDGGGGG